MLPSQDDRLDHSTCKDTTPNCHMIIVTEEQVAQEQEEPEEEEEAEEEEEEQEEEEKEEEAEEEEEAKAVQEEEERGGGEMARFLFGREEDENKEGPSNPRRRPVFKRRRTSAGVFSCSAVHCEPEPEQEPEQRCVIEERVIEEAEAEEEEEEEEAQCEEEEEEETQSEEEDWGSDYESDDNSEGLRGNRSIPAIPTDDGSIYAIPMEDPDNNLEGLRGNGSISEIPMEDPDNNLEGLRENMSIIVTLSNPDVLDCPICLEHLCVPVFQCENGHIACDSCCIKIANKCPSCSWPIGYNRCRAIEKVLESVKVSCMNKRYGCKEIMSYSKKTDHENACIYVPCCCPIRGCDFVGTSTKVYAHFSDKHAFSAVQIFFNAVHSIYMGKHQCNQILQMRTEGILFIINHSSDHVGSAVNIVCIGPATQKRRFLYELVATDGESSFKIESVAESLPNWSANIPLKKFLMIPRDVVNSSAFLKLDIFIEEREHICSGCCTT